MIRFQAANCVKLVSINTQVFMDVNYFMWSVNMNVSSMHLWATISELFLSFKMSMFYLNLPGADLCTQSMYMAWYWNYNSRMERNKKYKADFASQVVTVSWYRLTTIIDWSIGLCPHEIRLHFWKSGREIKSALRDEYLLGNTFIMWLL